MLLWHAHLMPESSSLNELIEDHALVEVPIEQRHSWLDLSWNTVGIVTTLIQIYIGAQIIFIAGMKIGILAGLTVALIGGLLGWGTGHIAYKTGLASGLLARIFGFGNKGSILSSGIFAFMIIGFIAAENVLLYKGFLFYFELEDTLFHQILIYGLLTLAWILLTAYGFKLVTQVSSIMLVSFLLVLLYMIVMIVNESGQDWFNVMSFGSQWSDSALAEMGFASDSSKFIFCVNILAGSAGALALLDADLGRYSRSSADIATAAFLGNIFLDVIMVFLGAMIMFAGMPALIDYYVNVVGTPIDEAQAIAIANPDRVAAAFVIFGGLLGTIIMFAAQSKAQVLNTYSSSLSLSNIFDAAIAWRPGRLSFVILANLLSLLFLYGNILDWFNAFLVVLGILTMTFAGIMIADYFLVRPALKQTDYRHYPAETYNWAGIITICISLITSHYLLNEIITLEIITALLVTVIVYPLLRIYILKPRYTTN